MRNRSFAGALAVRIILPLVASLLAVSVRADTAPSVQVAGAVQRPGDYGQRQLEALPAITQSVAFAGGGTQRERTYTGASLWAALNQAGIVGSDAHRNGDLLSRYVVATAADGYRTVFALGELNPEFGNKASLIAYAESNGGASAPLPAKEGPYRLTAPGDVHGGRYVSKLVRLEVRPSGSAVPAGAGGVSNAIAVSGDVKQVRSFDLAALESMPAVTRTVGGTEFKGVSLWALLNSLGLVTDSAAHNPTLAMYAVATGSDGYKAVVSLGELDPHFGNRDALVAYAANGAPLGARGFARLIVPGDQRMGRSVSNLAAIEVLTAPN